MDGADAGGADGVEGALVEGGTVPVVSGAPPGDQSQAYRAMIAITTRARIPQPQLIPRLDETRRSGSVFREKRSSLLAICNLLEWRCRASARSRPVRQCSPVRLRYRDSSRRLHRTVRRTGRSGSGMKNAAAVTNASSETRRSDQ